MTLSPDYKKGVLGIAKASNTIITSYVPPEYTGSRYIPWFLSIFYIFKLFYTFMHYLFNKSQKYVHLEVVFFPTETHSGLCIAFSVFTKGSQRQERKFEKVDYTHLYIAADECQLAKCYKYCNDCIKGDDIKFDNETILRLLCWPRESVNENRRTCHSFVMKALHKVNMMTHYRINTLTIDEIVSFLENSDRLDVNLTPHEMNKLKNPTKNKKNFK